MPSTVTKKTKSTEPRDRSTRDRVLDVATSLFADRGFGLTSMRDIANSAKIRAATLYHHFRSKEELYEEVLDRESEKIHLIVTEVLENEDDFPDQIRQMTRRAFDYHVRNPHLAKLSLRATLGDGLRRPHDQRWLGLMDGLLEPQAARGAIKDVETALFLVTSSAIITHHAIAKDTHPGLDPEEAEARAREHVTTMILRGLGLE